MILFIIMIVLISSILTPSYYGGWYGPRFHRYPYGFSHFVFGPRHHGPMHHGHMHHGPMGGHSHMGGMHHGPRR